MKSLRRCRTCFTCTVCCLTHTDKRGFYHGTAYCNKCHYIKCDVCSHRKGRSNFSDSQIRNFLKNVYLRCKQCSICVACGLEKNSKHFTGAAKECTACHQYKCTVCLDRKHRSTFSQSQLIYQNNQNSHVRCKQCAVCIICKQKKSSNHFDDGKKNASHALHCSHARCADSVMIYQRYIT